MRYLILFCLCVTVSFHASAAENTPAPVQAMMKYCLPALIDGIPPADIAAKAGLPEFAAEQAIKFAPDGGRVYGLPESDGNAVLVLNKNYLGVCSVAIKQMKAQDFWNGIEKEFGAGTEFRLLREKRIDEEHITRREYEADLNGLIAFIVSFADSPREGGMQGLMTGARVDRKPDTQK